MILTIKNEDGFVRSYMIAYAVNSKGTNDINGEYLYISTLWCHKSVDGQAEIMRFINQLILRPETKGIKYVYWRRIKDGKKHRISRSFPVELCKKNFIKYVRRRQWA